MWTPTKQCLWQAVIYLWKALVLCCKIIGTSGTSYVGTQILQGGMKPVWFALVLDVSEKLLMLLLRILVSKEWRGQSEQRAAFFLYYVSTKGYVISLFSLFFFLYKDSRYMVLFLFDNLIYVFLLLWLCILVVCLYMATLTEVFPCFILSCKANARVKPAKTGHGPHSS